jgi:serine-type D-Ala-D-Ala carboxypeptidase (penicillin-binding protein 5/6)
MHRLIQTFLAIFYLLVLSVPAYAFETRATSAFVLDQTTGTVLLNKNADQPLPPASMSKLMTLYMAFEALKDGRLRIDERLSVSQHAMSYQGSTMFLNTRDKVNVKDLLLGIIVLSGNDACAVIAEALSPDGTEAGFARLMTQRGQQLGMTNSTFANSNGWPAPNHRMSMRDLALLANRLISDFPEYYPMFAEREFAFDGRAPQNKLNRNPLLGSVPGADGMKTGHTEEAGYGLVGSAKQGDRRVIFVISGLGSAQARAEESAAITNWAFRQFAERDVVKSGTRLAEAPVWMGDAPKIGLVPEHDVKALFPVLVSMGVEAEVVFNGPIAAPVQKGQQLGELVIPRGDLDPLRVPLVAEGDVLRGGFVNRIKTVSTLLMGRLNDPARGSM